MTDQERADAITSLAERLYPAARQDATEAREDGEPLSLFVGVYSTIRQLADARLLVLPEPSDEVTLVRSGSSAVGQTAGMSPSKGTMPRSLRIPPDLWNAAVQKATTDGTTVTAVVIAALRDYVGDDEPVTVGGPS